MSALLHHLQVITSASNFLHFSEYGTDGSKEYRRPKKATVGAHAPIEGIRFSEYDSQDNKATLRTTSKLILDTSMTRYGAKKAPDLHPGEHNRPGWLLGKSPLVGFMGERERENGRERERERERPARV